MNKIKVNVFQNESEFFKKYNFNDSIDSIHLLNEYDYNKSIMVVDVRTNNIGGKRYYLKFID